MTTCCTVWNTNICQERYVSETVAGLYLLGTVGVALECWTWTDKDILVFMVALMTEVLCFQPGRRCYSRSRRWDRLHRKRCIIKRPLPAHTWTVSTATIFPFCVIFRPQVGVFTHCDKKKS